MTVDTLFDDMSLQLVVSGIVFSSNTMCKSERLLLDPVSSYQIYRWLAQSNNYLRYLHNIMLTMRDSAERYL